jgi:Ca-activated chloride channel family protein
MRTHKHITVWIAIVGITLWGIGCGGGGMADTGGDYNSNATGWNNIGSSGAQDIGQFRSILEQGGIPAANTLDANGFFSEHHTQLPPPECGNDICLHGMLAVHHDWVYGEYQAALQVAMNSTIEATSLERRPLDLVVVVDTSGSMVQGSALIYVKQGLHILIDELEPDDRMALVRYEGFVEVLATFAEPSDATALHALVDGLYADGATNFYDGLEAGLQMAANVSNPERQSRLIMLSDGEPTTGITDDESIIAMAEGYIADGVGLTTIGVGTNFNVELMRGLAERGSGNFYYLESAQAIQEVFTEELRYFVTPVAYDLQIEVVNGAGYTLGSVVGTHLWETDGYRGTINIPAVFLASRTSDDDPPVGDGGRRGGGSAILIQMIPNDAWPELTDPHRVAELRLSYRLPGSGLIVEQVLTVSNPDAPGAALEQPYYSHQAIEKNYAMYNMYLGLKDAATRAEHSHNEALWVLEQLEARGSAWNFEMQDEDIEADLLLVDRFMENLRAHGAWAVNPTDPDDPNNDACAAGIPQACHEDPCAYGGCEGDDYGFFGCSTARAADSAPMALALALIGLLGLLRRRRQSAAPANH